MKTPVGSLSLLALVQLVTAQKACLSLTTLFPDCAFPCVVSAGSAVGCTVSTDLACRCDPASSQAIQASAVGCVLAACTKEGELGSALAAGPAICGCAATAVPDATTTSEAPAETTTDVTTTSEAPETTAEATTTAEDTTGPITTTASAGDSTTTAHCDSESPCQASADVVPSCATGCISSAAVTVAGCAYGDYECQCSSTAVIQNAAQDCVIGDCGISGAIDVLNAVGGLCECVSANPTTPCTGTATEPPTDTTTQSETTQTETETESETQSETQSETETEVETTTTDNNPGPTCKPGTTEDCGPVASSAIPSCAHACFSSAAPNIGCGVDDYACQCGAEAQASLSQILVPCVITACDSGDLPAIITGASSVCACATAAPPAGDCTTTDDGTATATETETGSATKSHTYSNPTATETGGTTTPCPDATTQDCGPVATTAVPSCAHACFSSAAPKVGCDVDDYACQCEDAAQASLSQLLIPCVATACDSGDLPAVITGASSVCACANADPTGGCATGNPPGGSDTTTSEPTKTGGSGGDHSTTCADATTEDCGPVATSAVPSCAHACFSSAAPKVGCAVDDYACQCEDAAQASLSQLLIPCVATACDSGDLPAVITGASSVCACANAGPTGGCATGNPPHGGDTTTTAEPTETGGSGGDHSTTCADATTQDCGPIATSAVPSCAHACFSSAAPGVGCGVNDYACQCEAEAQASLSQLLIPCVATACDSGDLPAVITGASSVCACAQAGPTGGCATGNPPNGGHTTTPVEPTKTGGSGGGTTCAEATTSDCAPVASAAIPSCAQACFTSAAPSVGCDVDDYACQCGDEAQASLSQLLIPCVATACDSGELPGVITGASSVCACATAPPSGGDCGGSGGGGGGKPTKTSTPSYPTGGGGGEGSTCVAGPLTSADCGPIASSAVPSCAHACFSSAAPDVGCGVNDYACQCQAEAQASLSQLLIPCVATACDSGDLPAVITGASSVCACATAPASGGEGDCGGSGGGGGGEPTNTGGSSEPTGSGGEGSSCVAGPLTSADCASVASSAVPSCARACFSSAAPGVGCDVDDYACQCEADAQASLSQLLVPCVATACDSGDLPAVITGASAVCACATAPAAGGDCGGSEPTKTGDSSKPTGGSGGEGSTCVAGPLTSADCAPIASSAVPSCAHACFSSAAPGVGCGVDDYACQCEEKAQASLSELLVPCVATACDSDQLAGVIAGASSVCACATAPASGGNDCGSGGSGSGGSGSGGSDTTCVTVTKSGSGGEVTKSTSCYRAPGGGTLTTKSSPTIKGGESETQSEAASPSETGPAVVKGSAARFEMGIVAGVFGAFWLAAVAL